MKSKINFSKQARDGIDFTTNCDAHVWSTIPIRFRFNRAVNLATAAFISFFQITASAFTYHAFLKEGF